MKAIKELFLIKSKERSQVSFFFIFSLIKHLFSPLLLSTSIHGTDGKNFTRSSVFFQRTLLKFVQILPHEHENSEKRCLRSTRKNRISGLWPWMGLCPMSAFSSFYCWLQTGDQRTKIIQWLSYWSVSFQLWKYFGNFQKKKNQHMTVLFITFIEAWPHIYRTNFPLPILWVQWQFAFVLTKITIGQNTGKFRIYSFKDIQVLTIKLMNSF